MHFELARLAAGPTFDTYIPLDSGGRHNGANGRIATALFEIDEAARPHGVRWLRLHESWLPAPEVAAFAWEPTEPGA